MVEKIILAEISEMWMREHRWDLSGLEQGELVGPYEDGIERLGYLEHGGISWLHVQLLAWK